MTENFARDYCGEALASAGVKSNGSASSDRDQSKNPTGGDNNKASSRFTMDPNSGLTADVVKGSGKNIRTETVWISAAFEILGRVRDPKSEGWARLLRWRDDYGRFHEHPVSDEDLHTDPSLLCARLAGLGLRITTGPARAHRLNLRRAQRMT